MNLTPGKWALQHKGEAGRALKDVLAACGDWQLQDLPISVEELANRRG